MALEPATLYVIATPIGNLADLSPRAAEVLGAVDLLLCEDTRHTGHLLATLGLTRPLIINSVLVVAVLFWGPVLGTGRFNSKTWSNPVTPLCVHPLLPLLIERSVVN